MHNFKVIFLISLLIAAIVADDPPLVGGVTKLEGEKLTEAENTLKDSLAKVAAGDGPHYKISKIHSASHQVVSGSLYRLNVDLTDEKTDVTKKCDVSIWLQPWLDDGHEVTFECEGDEKLVKKLSTK